MVELFINWTENSSNAVVDAQEWFHQSRSTISELDAPNPPFGADGVFYATIAGLVAGLLVGKATEMYTNEIRSVLWTQKKY